MKLWCINNTCTNYRKGKLKNIHRGTAKSDEKGPNNAYKKSIAKQKIKMFLILYAK